MPRVSNVEVFSSYFRVSAENLEALGAFDCTLNVDSQLFIDPLLLQYSDAPEMSISAVDEYRSHFSQVIELAQKVRTHPGNRLAAAALKRLLTFREISANCLGYGASSTSGSGWGTNRSNVFESAVLDFVDLGLDDPDLILVLPLLEEGIGADLVSDMTTNVILGSLFKYTERITESLGIKAAKHEIHREWGPASGACPSYEGHPILLVPSDCLRELPIATDWDGVAMAASFNAQVRTNVSKQVGEIWSTKDREERARFRAEAKKSADGILAMRDAIEVVDKTPYDVRSDPHGLLFSTYARLFNGHELALARPRSAHDVHGIVGSIVEQFSSAIENNGIWKELYTDNTYAKAKHESSAQRLFFVAALAFCKANNLDLTPESDNGAGPVDFKVSSGFQARVLVELKLSTNKKAFTGYTKQVDRYRDAEETEFAFYVVVDVEGGSATLDQRLIDEKNRLAKAEVRIVTELVWIDGRPRKSASKQP